MDQPNSSAPAAPAAFPKIDLADPQCGIRFALLMGMSDRQAALMLRPTTAEAALAIASIDAELERRGSA
jgi:hypothetical protein